MNQPSALFIVFSMISVVFSDAFFSPYPSESVISLTHEFYPSIINIFVPFISSILKMAGVEILQPLLLSCYKLYYLTSSLTFAALPILERK